MASARATRADHAARMVRAREVMGDVTAGVAAVLLVVSTAISVFALYHRLPQAGGKLSGVAVASAAVPRSGISDAKYCPGTALPRQ